MVANEKRGLYPKMAEHLAWEHRPRRGTGSQARARMVRLCPDAIDPARDGKDGAIHPLPAPDVEGIGEERGPLADKDDPCRDGFPT